MPKSRCLKVAAGSIALMVIIGGCSEQEDKPVKGETNTQYVDLTELEETALGGERNLKAEGLKAQFAKEWKAEQERIAKEKEEAERKAKEEAKEKANPAIMGPVEKAQWENNNFADVHERANYLIAHRNHLDNINSDEQTKAYLNALNDSLESSGEMQTEALLNGEMGASE